ncbi:MAG: sialate O-acetylesterase [Rikenellaceae bacterium]
MKRLFFALMLTIVGVVAKAEVKMPAFFDNNMVLQQSSDVALWGEDAPGAKISIRTSWGERAAAVADSDGKWRTSIKTLAADNVPQSITVKGTSTKQIDNLLFGEVWLCSGQSNMLMRVADKNATRQSVRGGNDDVIDSRNASIRYFEVKRAAAAEAQSDLESENGWQEASPATTGNFSATAYYFARRVNEVLDIPVGVICTAWGATAIESWMDRETLSQFEGYSYLKNEKNSAKQHRGGWLYNAMINPFVGFEIKGFLWYQGERNRTIPHEYQPLLTTMIESWRAKWGDDNLPFYYVQIAPFFESEKAINSAFLREAQMKVMSSLEGVGMVSAIDIGEATNIHPGRKREVGERLAYWALAKQYGFDAIGFSGPIYKSMSVKDGRATIAFDYGHNMLCYDDELTGFEIAGEDRVFHPAKAEIAPKGSTVDVYSESVAVPVAVRYCFKKWAVGKLYNAYDLPASSFRTDDWDDVGRQD